MSQNQQGQQALKVGRDPRMLPEYEALRAEINKLSHASRPEVDWVRIHQLASQIFEKHGWICKPPSTSLWRAPAFRG